MLREMKAPITPPPPPPPFPHQALFHSGLILSDRFLMQISIDLNEILQG